MSRGDSSVYRPPGQWQLGKLFRRDELGRLTTLLSQRLFNIFTIRRAQSTHGHRGEATIVLQQPNLVRHNQNQATSHFEGAGVVAPSSNFSAFDGTIFRHADRGHRLNGW